MRQRSQQVIGEAASAGVTVELDLYPLHSQAFTDGQRCAPSSNPQSPAATPPTIAAVRGLDGDGRPDVPDRARVHRHERVQPAALRQPAVEHARAATSRPRSAGARSPPPTTRSKAVNRANFVWGVGLSPRGNDDAERAEQLVDLAGALPRGSRHLVQVLRRATHRDGAADGRPRLPPLPDPAVAPVRGGYARPERREHRQPLRASTRPSTTASTARRSGRSASSRAAGCRSASTRWGSRPTRPACPATTGSR